MREVDLGNYPSKIEFSHKIEDLRGEESINDISTVGRILGNSEQGYFLYHNGLNIRIDFSKDFPSINHGDVVLVRGDYKSGDSPTIIVKDISLCSKCIKEFPKSDISEEYGGLNLLLNKDKRETIILRSRIIKKIRNFLDNKGFLEVETPILQYYPDSAPVPTFSTKDNETGHEYHLRICPEEYLKRLTLGLDRVYEIGKCFRNSDKSFKHSPEFTMLEFYGSFLTYEDMMNLTEELVESLALELRGKTEMDFKGYKIDVKRPWQRITIREAGKKFYGFDPINISTEELKEFLEIKDEIPRNKLLALFIEKKIENLFVQPTFLTNYPAGVGAPDKTDINDKSTMERAEDFVAKGFELANLGSINNDPKFLEKHNTQNIIEKFGPTYVDQHLDRDFLYEMEFGLPPLACCGIGIDRLVMLLTNKSDVRETIVYPFKNRQ